tara:strand:+ start:3392 stop:4606 length:1215 start_codon:yes stop_codon:yes gene_type:complete
MKNFKYPLIYPRIYNSDKDKGIQVLKSGQITMSKITKKFEKNFAKYTGSKYALMVNSGSSANLLAATASCNPLRKKRFKRGDEVLLPGICWSTSLWPLIINGLKPIFVDVDVNSLNVNIDDLKKKITKKTKVICCVHVLGNSSNMLQIKKIAKEKSLIIIEDTCESLGSSFGKKKLGTFGDFGTYSFYYSHQISSGEGGMVVCNSKEDYEILLSLRAHGWSRDGDKHEYYKKKYSKLDERFIFVNMGFNLRPLEIQAAIANNQLKQINNFKKNRTFNRKKIISIFNKYYKKNNFLQFIDSSANVDSNWFGLPILINKKYKKEKLKIINEIEKLGIETRPIISGNFLNQPAIKLYKLNPKNLKLKNCQEVDDRGFFIGINTKKSNIKILSYVAKSLGKAFIKISS